MAAKTKRGIPLASMEKLCKSAGAERVSDGAKEVLRDILEDKAKEIALISIKIANHAGRKTVKAGDIRIAAKP